MITLDNVSKIYEGARSEAALKSISVSFDYKGFVSILGPSGCGKTTLLNIIGGLDTPTSGDLIINNTSISSFTERELDYYRSNVIGFIFQGYNLIPQLTVFENVKLGLDISSSNENADALVKEALEKVGIADLADSTPNKISGGQQQRAAIARAIVKRPKILLCDEPTGALDTKMGHEVLKILKEISNDCLVIMVTHNDELASLYSDRIIRMLDGKIESDDGANDRKSTDTLKLEVSKIPLVLSLKMALRNLIKKKKKNFLISLAVSIGIIGLALILGITTGFNHYLVKLEEDANSKYPIQIATKAYNVDEIMAILSSNSTDNPVGEKFPTDNKIFVEQLKETIQSYVKNNDITEEYVEYLNGLDKDLYNEIIIRTDQDISLNIYSSYTLFNKYGSIGDFTSQNANELGASLKGTTFLSMLPESQEFLESQYDCIYGHLPTNKNEMVIVVDEYNRLEEVAILSLGLSNRLVDDYYDIEDLVGTKYSLVLNNDRYNKLSSGNYEINKSPDLKEDLEIVGVIRPSKGTSFGMLKSGIAYTKELYNYINQENFNSDIAVDLRNELQITVDGKGIDETSSIRYFGATMKPYSINIYPKSNDAKVLIVDYLEAYNVDKPLTAQIMPTDYMGILTDTISSLVKQITYILYAFVALSIIVSSIMIGVITYSSIVERTKEIGILRSLGARRKDVSRLFNFENGMLGITAGVIGVILALIVGVILNLFVESKFGIVNVYSMTIYHVIILIFISLVLTVLSGALPAYILSGKKPVSCIRSE